MKSTLPKKMFWLLCLGIFVKTEILVFQTKNYKEICNPLVTGHAIDYEAAEIYEFLFERFSIQGQINYQEFISRFTQHHTAIKEYLANLNQIENIMKENQLLLSKRNLFRE